MGLTVRKQIYHWWDAIASPTARRPYLAADERTLADLQEILTRLELAPQGIQA